MARHGEAVLRRVALCGEVTLGHKSQTYVSTKVGHCGEGSGGDIEISINGQNKVAHYPAAARQ